MGNEKCTYWSLTTINSVRGFYKPASGRHCVKKKSQRLTFQDHTAPEQRPSGTFQSAIIYDLRVTAMILRQSETVAAQFVFNKTRISNSRSISTCTTWSRRSGTNRRRMSYQLVWPEHYSVCALPTVCCGRKKIVGRPDEAGFQQFYLNCTRYYSLKCIGLPDYSATDQEGLGI